MAATQPLTGIALIDCAKANATQGAAEAARLCGYGTDISSFRSALTKAGDEMGVTLNEVKDLITDQFEIKRNQGMSVAPESPQNL
ncbi:MAG: hypothetical protein AAFO06_06185 [Cyanobacteria bacterium J06597_16]